MRDLRRRALLADLGPEVDSSFHAGLRASGKSSTRTTRPTRMSTLQEVLEVDHGPH